ncbi:MAG: PAS domain-containing protein, partial [Methylococcaceae bacterium]|nr:PAS domain-containing protein [Methylococcaceae bacterium]
MKAKSYFFLTAVFSLIFGLLFPIGATLLTVDNIFNTTLSSLIDLHLQTPLLLIIDTAPFFLGVFGAYGGYSLGKLTELNTVLLEQERIANDLTALIDTANAPIFGIDTAGLVNEWNQAAERITGYSKSEVM